MDFFANFWRILKIVVPSWTDEVVFDLTTLTIFLTIRTFLSIYISNVNGSIVQQVVRHNLPDFISEISKLGIISLPASFVNSYLDFLTKKIALKFRCNMTKYFHSLYVKDLIYYQVDKCNVVDEPRHPHRQSRPAFDAGHREVVDGAEQPVHQRDETDLRHDPVRLQAGLLRDLARPRLRGAHLRVLVARHALLVPSFWSAPSH